MDLAFIRFYLNDFNSAKKGDDSNAVFIEKMPYIQVLSCGSIAQFSKVKEGISFVGGIKVELIDCCESVLDDVTPFFSYDTYMLDGLPQINWEFGKTGIDYWYKNVYLRITDLINANLYYSNSFMLSNVNSELSSEFIYKENARFRDIPYDLKDFYQRVRFHNCYYKDSVNAPNIKQYTKTSGKQTNYRSVTTFGKRHIFSKLDIAIENRITEMFAHSIVYLNGERVKLQEYKSNEIQGDTNFKTATFNVNPQEEYFDLGLQLLEPLSLISFTPSGRYTSQVITPINRTFSNIFALEFGSNTPIINNKTFNNKFSDVFGA
jgi:hypothetical protein